LEPRRRDTRADRLSHAGSATGRALVIEPVLRRARGAISERTPEARLDEAVGLARAIDLSVEQSGIVMLGALRPATHLGKGKVEEIAGLVKTHEAGVVVMDCALTPVQQRNLEKEWNAKVVDRTGLILEIFGRRARTREGALQVEHAHLTYQKSSQYKVFEIIEASWTNYGDHRAKYPTGLNYPDARKTGFCLGAGRLTDRHRHARLMRL
jgi:GTP-binding protein HflX